MPENILYLIIPYRKREEAKELGCRWDNDKFKWYYNHLPSDDQKKVLEWYKNLKIYLKVPFEEKDTAKELGCFFDPEIRHWYICSDDNELKDKLPKHWL